MAALYDIILNIAANTTALQEGLKRAEDAVGKFASAVKSVFSVAIVGEMAHMVEQTLATGHALEEAANKAGISGKAFQQLAYIGSTVGVSAETISSSSLKLSRNLSLAGDGAKNQSEALRALGLHYSEIKQLKPEEQFFEIGKKIGELQNVTDQARASQALFGRSYQELLPIFKMSADEMERLKKNAPIVSDKDLKAMEEADKKIKEMEASIKSLFLTLSAKTAPAVGAFAEAIKEALKGEWYKAGEAVTKAAEDMGLYPKNYTADRAWAQAMLRKRAMDVLIESPIADTAGKGPPGYGNLEKLTGVAVTARRIQPGDVGGGGPLGRFYAELSKNLDGAGSAQEKLNQRIAELNELWNAPGGPQISAEDYVKEIQAARAAYDDVDRQIQQIAVNQKHLTLAATEYQVAMRGMVQDFQTALSEALNQSGSFGRNLLRNILRALEDRAIFNAISEIGDALRKALSPSAEKGTGLFGGIAGAIIGAVFGYGGAGSTSGSTSGSTDTGGPGSGSGTSKFASRGGYVTNNYIDARGADADRIMTLMPGLLNQASEKAKRDILNSFQRSGIPAPRSA